jgi:hypothetical protein|tara:strand:- start:366 stop:635 length:270 start_codon:yes stop_codon:yes gene_type:complete
MQTEEWMKRRKEEQRMLRAHNTLTKQVNENIKELENRNGNIFPGSEFNETDNENLHLYFKSHLNFNTRIMLKLEKRISELEQKLAELTL